MAERKVKRKEVRERLNVTRYGYEQMIADGILEPPIRSENKHPFHTESQIRRAQQRLYERANKTSKPVNIDDSARKRMERMKAKILRSRQRAA